MTTFAYQGKDRFYFGARAFLLEESRETASEWATKYINTHPAHSYILGKFVEADKANNNQQYFTLQGLRMGKPTIQNAPMNINHSARNIVGAFVASELVYPSVEGAQDGLNPFIESLGVFWKYYFPDEYRTIQAAHESASLFYSMECVPRAVSTVGGQNDSIEYPYEGVSSANYPEEINKRLVPINLVDPVFVGGALIIPPTKPGWSRAEVKSIAAFMADKWDEAERTYDDISEALPDEDPKTWEAMMQEIIYRDYVAELSRSFTQDQRDALAKTGEAMPDGSFPIVNVEDLQNAIRLAGRAKDPDAAKIHIKKRAKVIGHSEMIPETWK